MFTLVYYYYFFLLICPVNLFLTSLLLSSHLFCTSVSINECGFHLPVQNVFFHYINLLFSFCFRIFTSFAFFSSFLPLYLHISVVFIYLSSMSYFIIILSCFLIISSRIFTSYSFIYASLTGKIMRPPNSNIQFFTIHKCMNR